jgi:crotonobetainyl-CoA:carnitine CoA-transferase CaiB-like acyl-CoA transferase
MMAAWEGDHPQSYPPGFADIAGATMTCMGTLAALLEQRQSGVGQKVEASQLGAMLWLQSFNLANVLLAGSAFRNLGRDRAENPLYNYYRCSDGRWAFLACSQGERHWGAVCRVLSLHALAEDPRFSTASTRTEHAAELVSILDTTFAARDYDELAPLLVAEQIIFVRICELPDMAEDEQVLANGYIAEIEDQPGLRLPALPFSLSRNPPRIRSGAPSWGANTADVLKRHRNFNDADIAAVLAETG